MFMKKYILNFSYAFRPRKPLLTLRLVATFLGIFFRNKRPLRYVDLAIGYACNLLCEHCFANGLKRNGRRTLTPVEYGAIVKQAMALGAVNFSFQGGEPTLYPELLEFIRHSSPERNLISVTTNATLLDRRSLAELKKAGVDILTISLDSAVAEEHDRFRGVPGTFAKVMETIRLARAMGFKITLGGVVSSQNIRSAGLVQLIEFAHKLGVIIFLALATPVGEWAGKEEVILAKADHEHLAGLLKRYPLLRTDFEANFVHHGCGAVKEILYLTPYGDVLACPFLHMSLGNVFEAPLADIRDRALEHPSLAAYAKVCLAAEDPEFMGYNRGSFYGQEGAQDGVPRTLAACMAARRGVA